MATVVLAWAVFPAVLALVALGFGELVARLAGRPMGLSLRLAAGFCAYVAWASLGTVAPLVAKTVGVGAILLTVAGLVLALRRTSWRPVRPEPGEVPLILGALAASTLAALPFVLTGHAVFGGYGSLGDGGFQMVGATLLPEIGATTHGLEPSSVSRLMHQYFEDGYPAGAVLALGYPTQWLGAWSLQTFQPFQAVLLAVGGIGAAGLAVQSGLVRGRWTALVAFAAGAAPLTAAFALQGSIKEAGGAAIFLVVAATAAWAWKPLLNGDVRAGIPTGLAVAAGIGVVGPGLGPLLLAFGGLVALTLLVLVVRGVVDRGVWKGAAVTAGVAVLVAIPAILAAVEVSGVAGSVLTAKQELGNLPGALPWWRSLAGWDTPDFRLLGEFGHPGISKLTAVLVGVLVLGTLAHAVRRRAWVFVVVGVASAVTAAYIVRIGSPWAGGKALAIAAMAFWAVAATGVAALASDGDRRLRIAGGLGALALVAIVLVTAGSAYRGVRLSPTERFDELRDLAAVTGDRDRVLVSEFDEFAKVAFERDRPQVLGETSFADVPLHDAEGAPLTAVQTPPEDTISPADLARFGWIVVRRGPVSAWPSPSFRLVRTTAHYQLFRRTTTRVPAVWTAAAAQDDAAGTVSCRTIRELGPTAFALVRAPSVAVRLTTQPKFWIPRQPDGIVFDLRGAGHADQPVAVPATGRYRVWVEGTFNRRMTISVDGRPVAAVGRGATNQFVQPERATGEDGVELQAGARTLRVTWPGSGIAPGSARSAGAVGRVWFEPVESAPKLVAAKDLRCTGGRVSVDWYGRW
ncbi:hypothetical protein [Patulibacter minatonensis]|uniref:hypothetical protein n=1 Tax=Patulibacter minatonensis TaxID=298163 RepID=UPI00047C33A3|nr:hypothetical protein [Patulibacter minatonensis]